MGSNIQRYFHFFLLMAVLLAVSSCTQPPKRLPPIYYPLPSKVSRHDIRHTVAPGETVWRLAKMYDVSNNDIMRENRLRKPEDLKTGQTITIPNAAPMRHVIPLFPSHKWKYIIIHHSATEEGNSLRFNEMHLNKGWDKGVGYHFVIDNGTMDKHDGQIEATPRWIKQQDGAHCKANDMNTKGIGICLVGNFSKDNVSSQQMDSLIYLVKKLQAYYRIPSDHILGHGQVRGAATECPGTRFPWTQFFNRL